MAIEVRIKKDLSRFRLNVQFYGKSKRIGILGASGCGKSMTLKSITGIEQPDEGFIKVDEKVLFDSEKKINLKPQKRNIGYLFQNYALFPTMTVAKNIEAGINGNKKTRQEKVKEMIDKFQLAGLENHLPSQLSGGQQQRTALARIMAYQPSVILLDEPFSALDIFLRDQLQRELVLMLRDYTGTVIMVSHSRDEIYRFSDEILVLDKGKDVIYGNTKEVFANPVYREVAKLTGCKNFSNIKKIGPNTIEATDWGISLHIQNPVPEYASCIGYRAHDFVPVWGERPQNSLRVQVADTAKLPFETNYYLLPENSNKNSDKKTEVICWFVQRGQLPEIKEKGMPNYLEIREEKIMFLEERIKIDGTDTF